MPWDWLVERRWQEAQDSGALQDLAGQGKPLRLEDDSAVPPEWRMTFHVLRQAGMAPDWVEAAQRAQALMEAADRNLRLALAHDHGREGAAWERAVNRFECDLEEANRWIDVANLKAPHASLHRRRWNVLKLMGAITGERTPRQR